MSVAAPSNFQALWATPLGVHHLAQPNDINEVLVRVFKTMRLADGQPGAAFHASRDDLLRRINISEWQQLVQFIVGGIRDTVVQANSGHWPQAAPAFQIALNGIWFQISNSGVHHDIHTHGNCSWSGVYCLQVDAPEQRHAHPVLGALNGVTRFYGPHFQHLGGAHADFGNAYLLSPHIDIEPVPGQLVVFPSWLAHQAMPYQGEQDRVIVSFNASVHSADGNNQLQGYART